MRYRSAAGAGGGGQAVGAAVSAATANGIASLVTGGQGVTNPWQLAAITTTTTLLGAGAAAALGQNPNAAVTGASNETLNNTCANGHNCGENLPENRLPEIVPEQEVNPANPASEEKALAEEVELAAFAAADASALSPVNAYFGVTADEALAGGLGDATNNAVAGSVANANFAQSSINAAGTFSAEGAAKYSQLAGVPINTVGDLTAAISNGLISPSQLPVDYVVASNGTQLILNTRTSAALSDAGIPQSQWYGVNQTGVQVPGMPAGTTFDDLATAQLARNKLPPTGTSNVPTGSK